MSDEIEHWSASHDGHGAMSIETADGRQICFVRNEKHAHLVAAAPELLEALIAVMGALERHFGKLDPVVGTPMSKAYAAIAKATGA
ncbi:hypothetical protein [Burkholderia territorii]|uniref:hypothetical protein n=1 Tax=Burkholderia territorii TaxID=1503055 RepID=UPI0012D9EA46|nr:hypothetical protein [Burkholderia territorii]